MKFSVLPIAELEASDAALWYDEQRFGLGDDFADELLVAFEKIMDRPRELPKLGSYTGTHELRRFFLSRFPYLVIFECRPDEILVIAVAHARRKPFYWLDRLT